MHHNMTQDRPELSPALENGRDNSGRRQTETHLQTDEKELHQVWTTESDDSDSCAQCSSVNDYNKTRKSTSERV